MTAEATTLNWTSESLARALNQPPPTPEQRAVIEAPLTPGLVLAGAGSGKTETMAARVVFLIANGLTAPDDVLGLTFTRKAAGELAERIRRRLARLAGVGGLPPDLVAALQIGQPRVATYNSYAAGIVVEHGPRIGAEPSAEVIGQAMSWGHAASLVEDYGGDMKDVNLAPSTVTIDVLALSAAMAEHEVHPDELRAHTAALLDLIEGLPRSGSYSGNPVYAKVRPFLERQRLRLKLLPLVEAYRARKRSAGVIDYSDQVSLAARIAAVSPVVGALERQRYGAVLLDEFQDTSYGQLELMSRLFGGGHPVTAVGDPSQAIYGWRGASTGNMREFARRFGSSAQPGRTQADVYPLSVSWRNGAGILGIANDIAKLCADAQLPVVTLTPAPSRTDPGEIACALLSTQTDEVTWLADEIAKRWAVRTAGKSFAVLSRARSLLRPVAAALRERDVPVEVLGLGGLIDEPEVSDVVATLRVISDPSSGDAIGRLLVGPRWRIGPRDLMALGRRARWLTRQQLAAPNADAPASPAADPATAPPSGVSEETGSLIEALADLGPASAYSAEGHRRLSALNEELSLLRRRSGVSLADLIDDVVATLGLGIEVAVRPAVTHARAQAHLQALHEVAEEFTRIAEVPSLSAFLSYLEAAEDEERGLEPGEVQTSDEAISLLTVHGAKGLEWDVVAVPGLTKDVFPQNVASRTEHWLTDPGHLPVSLCGDRDYLPDLDLTGVTDQKAAETAYLEAKRAYQDAAGIEEWRLAYVAVTRARTTLLCSGSWWTPGVASARGASPVLELVRDHALAAGSSGAITVWAAPPEDEATNPMSQDYLELAWPVDPLPPARRVARESAAALVAEPPEDPMTLDSLAWDAEVDLLLAERDRHRATTIDVAVPAQLSVSELVALRRSPGQLARWIRRPMPSAPAPLARRGTAFHAWLEQRFGATRLVDLDELPGSADDGAAPDEDLDELKAAFLASEWANREPTEVEVPFHVRVGEGLSLRGRMDAVFGDAASGFEVVDWKTGAVPTGVDKQATAIQLAAYRLAWASLAGVDVEQVKAAFVYVRHNETVRPSDLATADELLALIRGLPAV